jgi:hypothetical protein
MGSPETFKGNIWGYDEPLDRLTGPGVVMREFPVVLDSY